MNQRFFVTSTGTGIGKSFITAALVRQAKAMDRGVGAHKPIITGFDSAGSDNDAALLLRSLDMSVTPENIERMSPWRFTAPLAPSMAARIDERSIDFGALVVHTRGVAIAEDVVVVEGVGGVMVPLTDKHTVLDWIEEVEMPVLLVAGSYLGSLSHTLTALGVLQQRQIPIHAVIVNESENAAVSLNDTVSELSRWTRLPIVAVKRRASQDGWQDVKELRGLLS
jgi:dethiobiotin synthetase